MSPLVDGIGDASADLSKRNRPDLARRLSSSAMASRCSMTCSQLFWVVDIEACHTCNEQTRFPL